jgi:hypothetical protein
VCAADVDVPGVRPPAVTVMLPLGLCFLPAFVLVGLVPVLISLAGRAFG